MLDLVTSTPFAIVFVMCYMLAAVYLIGREESKWERHG